MLLTIHSYVFLEIICQFTHVAVSKMIQRSQQPFFSNPSSAAPPQQTFFSNPSSAPPPQQPLLSTPLLISMLLGRWWVDARGTPLSVQQSSVIIVTHDVVSDTRCCAVPAPLPVLHAYTSWMYLLFWFYFQSLLMAHAIHRVSYSTCVLEERLFCFLAREPRGPVNLQYCHVFTAPKSKQVTYSIKQITHAKICVDHKTPIERVVLVVSREFVLMLLQWKVDHVIRHRFLRNHLLMRCDILLLILVVKWMFIVMHWELHNHRYRT